MLPSSSRLTPRRIFAPEGLRPGNIVRIQGRTEKNADFFEISFECATSEEYCGTDCDVAMSIKVDFERKRVIRASTVGQASQRETGSEVPPIVPGNPFDCIIFCESDSYKVTFNGDHYCNFPMKVPAARVTLLRVAGDVQLSGFSLDTGEGSSHALPLSAPRGTHTPHPVTGNTQLQKSGIPAPSKPKVALQPKKDSKTMQLTLTSMPKVEGTLAQATERRSSSDQSKLKFPSRIKEERDLTSVSKKLSILDQKRTEAKAETSRIITSSERKMTMINEQTTSRDVERRRSMARKASGATDIILPEGIAAMSMITQTSEHEAMEARLTAVVGRSDDDAAPLAPAHEAVKSGEHDSEQPAKWCTLL